LTQPQFYPPQQPMFVPPPQNGLGTAGFVLGLLGFLFSPIPIVGVIAWPLVILGVTFSAVGVGKANKGEANNRGLAVAGVVLSILGLVICVLWVAILAAAA
jgi:hypothetical protein